MPRQHRFQEGTVIFSTQQGPEEGEEERSIINKILCVRWPK